MGLLRRGLLIAAMLLIILTLRLWQVTPPADACEAPALVNTTSATTLAVWDDGTVLPLLQGDPLNLTWVSQPAALYATDDIASTIIRVGLTRGRVAPWGPPEPVAIFLQAIDPAAQSVYYLTWADSGERLLYRADMDGTHPRLLMTAPSSLQIERRATDDTLLLYSHTTPEHSIWTHLDPRTAAITEVMRSARGQGLFVGWGAEADMLLFWGMEGYVRVPIAAPHQPRPLPLPADYLRPWTYSSEPSAFLFMTTPDDSSLALYHMDWRDGEPRFLMTLDNEDTFIAQVDTDHVLYRDTNVAQFENHLALLNIETAAVTPFDLSISGHVRWLPDEQRYLFTDVGSPLHLLSLYPLTGEVVTHVTLPQGVAPPVVPPCADSYWYDGATGLTIGRLDDPAAPLIETGIVGEVRQWLDLRPVVWHPRALLAAGVGLLLGVGLLPFIRRRRRG